jgi:hypothetical protein
MPEVGCDTRAWLVKTLREKIYKVSGAYRSFPALPVVQQHPIINAILELASVLQDLAEEFAHKVIVGRLFEAELPNIVEIDRKLLCILFCFVGSDQKSLYRHRSLVPEPRTWERLGKLFDRRALLLLADFFVFLLVRSRLETLPRQSSTQKIHENVTKRL